MNNEKGFGFGRLEMMRAIIAGSDRIEGHIT